MPEKLLEEAENAAEKRKAQLEKEAPLEPRGVWMREGMKVYLCGTLGQQFDAWQRRLSALSAADAYFSQQIGLEAIEKKMDAQNEAMKYVLYDRSRFLGQAYIDAGEIDFDNRRILNNMHHSYHFGLLGQRRSRYSYGCGQPFAAEKASLKRRIL